MDATRICSVDGCESPHHARGFCSRHNARWLRYGDPLGGGPDRPKTPEDAFARYTSWDGDCLVWTGHKYTTGYGSISVGGIRIPAHRYAWVRVHGDIPEGMLVDHRDCYNPACVNVEHLRLATRAQNARNRSGAVPRSKTGIRNVERRGNSWRVVITKDGQAHNLGSYQSAAEAAAVAEQGRRRFFGDYAGQG